MRNHKLGAHEKFSRQHRNELNMEMRKTNHTEMIEANHIEMSEAKQLGPELERINGAFFRHL